MQFGTQSASVTLRTVWTGRIISAFPVLVMVFSGVMKLMKPDPVLQEFARLGYTQSLAPGIGALEIACTVLYLLPRTSILGAILLTGYLGGATATHVRIGEPFFAPVVVGVLVWLGLFLREDRLRELLPLRD